MEHVENAVACLRQIETLIAKSDNSKIVPGVPLMSIVTEALAHLQQASTAAFNQHVHFALSSDIFNPFNSHEIDRTYSCFAVADQARTLVIKKHLIDPDPTVRSRTADEQMGSTVSEACEFFHPLLN